MVVVEVYICPRPSTFPPITQVFMVYVGVYLVLLVMLMILFMKKKEVIVGVMVQDLEVGLKRSATLTFKIMDKVLIVVGELDIGIRISPLRTIIQVSLVYPWGFIVMVITEVEIGLRPSNFLHITMVEYTFLAQYSLNKLF